MSYVKLCSGDKTLYVYDGFIDMFDANDELTRFVPAASRFANFEVRDMILEAYTLGVRHGAAGQYHTDKEIYERVTGPYRHADGDDGTTNA